MVISHDRAVTRACDRVAEMAAGPAARGYVTNLLELLSLAAVQRSAIGLLIGAVSLPMVGVFIVGLDIVAVRFAVMQVVLLGIAVGLFTGLYPMLCGLVACALAGAGAAPLASRSTGLTGAMGLMMTFAIGDGRPAGPVPAMPPTPRRTPNPPDLRRRPRQMVRPERSIRRELNASHQSIMPQSRQRHPQDGVNPGSTGTLPPSKNFPSCREPHGFGTRPLLRELHTV